MEEALGHLALAHPLGCGAAVAEPWAWAAPPDEPLRGPSLQPRPAGRGGGAGPPSTCAERHTQGAVPVVVAVREKQARVAAVDQEMLRCPPTELQHTLGPPGVAGPSRGALHGALGVYGATAAESTATGISRPHSPRCGGCRGPARWQQTQLAGAVQRALIRTAHAPDTVTRAPAPALKDSWALPVEAMTPLHSFPATVAMNAQAEPVLAVAAKLGRPEPVATELLDSAAAARLPSPSDMATEALAQPAGAAETSVWVAGEATAGTARVHLYPPPPPISVSRAAMGFAS
ncbi:UNVERIFIED_CONTAM: hypothetical protein K2H54_010499 [Gekko kuhli]